MLKEANFFEEQQAANEEDTITSDEDDPIDFDSSSQSLQEGT